MKRLVTVVTFLLSVWAAKWLFRDWTAAWLLVGSIAIHEFGHMLAVYAYGGKPNLLFIPLLGAATLYTNEEFERLNWFQRAILGLSGCIFNFLILVASILIYQFGEGGKYWLFLTALNSSLVVFNLLPLGIFDGGHFARALFSSLDEKDDRLFARAVTSLSYIACFTLAVMGKLTFFHVGIAFGMLDGSRKDDPREAYSPRAMTRSQAIWLTLFYCLMLFVAMVIDVYMPSILKIIR